VSADLHTHSTASDGRSTPAQLVSEAVGARLTTIALTDHDTFDGLDEARAAAEGTGLRVLPGVELSTLTGGMSVHVLGYGDLRGNAAMLATMRATVASREGRVVEMARRLAAGEGLDASALLAALAARTPAGATPGRPHLADALIDLGVVATRDEAFPLLLAEGGPYYVTYSAPATRDAVVALRAAGGVPVLAHPRGRRGDVLTDSQIADLVDAGLMGLEVDHRDHDDIARYGLRILAKDLGILVTGSSDYHGAGKQNALGENTTDPAVVEEIAAAATGW
jgi:hypothetical protein